MKLKFILHELLLDELTPYIHPVCWTSEESYTPSVKYFTNSRIEYSEHTLAFITEPYTALENEYKNPWRNYILKKL